MPNFNTKEMKIAFYGTKGDSSDQTNSKRLSPKSIANLKSALIHAVKREKDYNMVVAFDGYYIHPTDFATIKKELVNGGVEVLPGWSDLLVLRTEEGYVVAVKLCGGTINAEDLPAEKVVRRKRTRRQSDDSNRDPKNKKRTRLEEEEEAAAPGPLTQECHGLF